MVDLEEGGRVWVSFKYERLPIICYWCGHLDHDERDCSLWIESKGTLKHQDKQFGPFMRASLTVNPRKIVLHVSGFYEDREDHQPNREKPKASSGSHSEMATSPENIGPPPSGEKANTETSSMAMNAINADVPLVVSRSRIDVEMTTDTLDKAASSSPPAGFHHPNVRDVSTMGGGSSMGVVELLPKISNLVLGPKITGTYAEDDPFLVKLQEIDSDFQEFDNVPCEKKECSVNKQSAQIFQTEDSQNGEIGLLGSTIGEQKKSVEQGKSKASKGLDGNGKIGLGPGPQKEIKKGQLTRINRPNYDVVEEVSYGADGLKRKARETQAREELHTEKEKKQKIEEETKNQSVLFATQWGSADVAEQPRREQ